MLAGLSYLCHMLGEDQILTEPQLIFPEKSGIKENKTVMLEFIKHYITTQ